MAKLNYSSTSPQPALQMEENKGATSTSEVLWAGELSGGEGRWSWSSLIGWKQALPLGVLQNGVVAEVVLVRGLNAEGPLSSHASHCLAHVERPHVLDLGQTDVQCTKGSCRGVRKRTMRLERLEEEQQLRGEEYFPSNT